MNAVRLGGGQAGYGDAISPVADLVAADIDYLVCDALAESTLTVLQKDRERDERLGYTRDLERYLKTTLEPLVEGRTRIISNGGGLNPVQASRRLVDRLRDWGASGLTVATVVGDDVRSDARSFGLPDDVTFANVYLGARGVVEALELGADVVVTGRVADASLFLAPLVHRFGWSWEDWDLLAAGVTIGHLLECSAQASGSVYSGDWWSDPLAHRAGFPIAEVESDGSATITKPADTGGRVSFDTVREQLLYEVHDPTAYLNPDCTADFTSVRLTEVGPDCVRIDGCAGSPPPATHKVIYGRPDGWALDALVGFAWPDAEAKARAMARNLRRRAAERDLEVLEWCEEYFGAGGFHGDAARQDLADARRRDVEPPEVVARVAWRCADDATARRVAACRAGGHTPAGMSPIGRPKRREPTQIYQVGTATVDRVAAERNVRVELHDV